MDTGTGEEQDRKYHSGALSMRSQGLLSFLEKNRDSFASLGDSVHSSVSSTTTAETTRKSFDLSDIEEHVNDLRTKAVQWTQLSSLFDHRGHCSCVDGREERSVVGMPGGDAGEFLLCLACVETIKGTQLDQEAISKALASRIKAFGGFYVHTDSNALTALLEKAKAKETLREAAGRVCTGEDFVSFLCSRDHIDHRADLLELLLEPFSIGCGHLRLMSMHPEEYGVRPGLVSDFLRVFYTSWWAGNPHLYFTVLDGEHMEVAVVNVFGNDCEPGESSLSLSSFVPALSPSCEGRQIFVNHPDVSAFIRKGMGRFLGDLPADHPLQLSPEQVSEFETEITMLGGGMTGATLGHLAGGLPIYNLTLRRDGTFDLTSQGVVSA